jgi:DNA-binding response OmpR family regulator
MNTRKILVISPDKDLISIIKISALTLTKLNCQVSIEEDSDYESALSNSSAVNLDLIIIDNDLTEIDSLKLLNEIRNNRSSKNKKIIYLFSGKVNREEVFKAGCDSIMSKEEFKRVVNNILVF